jgi:hypothetical protein
MGGSGVLLMSAAEQTTGASKLKKKNNFFITAPSTQVFMDIWRSSPIVAANYFCYAYYR